MQKHIVGQVPKPNAIIKRMHEAMLPSYTKKKKEKKERIQINSLGHAFLMSCCRR